MPHYSTVTRRMTAPPLVTLRTVLASVNRALLMGATVVMSV